MDLVDEENADKILGPKKAKGEKAVSGHDQDTTAEVEDGGEELPSWQDTPNISALHVDNTAGTSSTSTITSASTRYVLYAFSARASKAAVM